MITSAAGPKTGCFSDLLNQEFAKRQSKNPKYSLRAFANHLNMDPSNLSKVLRGQKKLSDEKIWDLGLNLSLEPEKIFDFIGYSSRSFLTPLDHENFKDVNHWIFDAILELNSINSYNGNIPKIAKKLGVSDAFCHEAFKLLIEKKFLIYDTNKNLYVEPNPDNVIGINEPTSEELKLYQERILLKSIESIKTTGLEKREHFAFISRLSLDHKKQIEKLVSKFRKDLTSLLLECDKDNPEEVFAFQFGFFPLTQELENKEKENEI